MKDLFYLGGSTFMGTLTVLFVITTAWIIYHFVSGYNSKQANKEKTLKMIEYGKSMGLFTMIVGFLGQMVGFVSMFEAIEQAADINPNMVFGGIKVTMICPIYGMLIFLFTLLLWFSARMLIEKKFE
jgi:hypothetical protein